MNIQAKNVFKTLSNKGVKFVHHANSVLTSCQFLRQGTLMSRGSIEQKKLFQTPQKSDQIDKDYNIWFDLFFDSVDIHDRAKDANAYGPVLFVFDINLLKDVYTCDIWVSKLNPTKWEGKSNKDMWFSSSEELDSDFTKGRFDQMIILRHCGGVLPFKNFLTKVILDDPKLATEIDNVGFYSMAFGALKLAMSEGGINVPIEKRQCQEKCKCIDKYKLDQKKSTELFVPILFKPA